MSTVTKTVRVPKQQIVSTVCDVCGKREDGSPGGWVHLQYGHGDWGNDSVDSWETQDTCSPACFVGAIRKIVRDYEPGPRPTLQITSYDMDYAFASEFARWVGSPEEFERAEQAWRERCERLERAVHRDRREDEALRRIFAAARRPGDGDLFNVVKTIEAEMGGRP